MKKFVLAGGKVGSGRGILLKNRINIHRHSRWFFIFGQLALILPAARKPRL